MEKNIINVEGMSCEHCVKSITDTLSKISGITNVMVSLENKNITVEHEDNISLETIKNEIEDIGYDVV